MSRTAEVLGPGGLISGRLPGYEVRPQQLEMVEAVENALESQRHLIVEAGTGTGKSLAYLIPAVLSGRRVLVSTAGKALQEQIAKKDVPFLQSVLGDFSAAVLKGRGNYLCQYAWNELLADGVPQELAGVAEWLEDGGAESACGDLESLSQQVDTSKITVGADACLGKQCPFHGTCYAERAKAAAASAQIIIVNHTLLTLDLAIRRSSEDHATVIPDRGAVVIDEAHTLEEWATDAFTTEISAVGVQRLARDKFLDNVIIGSDAQTDVEYRADSFFQALAQMQPDQYTTSYVIAAPTPRLQSTATDLVRALETLQFAVARAVLTEESPENEQLRKKYVLRVESYAAAVRGIFRPSEADVVYAEVKTGARGKKLVYLKRSPISVADDLRETLFNRWPVICTSATLATGTGADFSYFIERCGVSDTKYEEPVELSVGSPFDYHANSVLYLPPNGTDYDPTRFYRAGSIEYFDRLARQIEQLLLASDGRAFCLFTSNKALNEIYNRIAHRLRWLVLKQGDAPRSELLKQFKENGHAVLFGLKSFWEGIDVQGDALSLVVIDKLPFQPPDDPVYAARCEQLNRKYNDKWAWFRRLALPTAIIQLKQGFGRLIRTKTDRGTVAILDGRLTCKAYGTQVVNALPPAARTSDLEAVRVFFEQRTAV